MSRSLNKVQLIGNLGQDPKVTEANGKKVANLSLATSRSWKDASGELVERVEWHRLVLWDNKNAPLATLVEKYCHKGDKLYAEGYLETRVWKDKEGKDRYTTEVIVREVILLGQKRAEGSEPAPDVQTGVVPQSDDDLPF